MFSGNIGFQTIFDGAKFTMEKLGYGLKGNEFKVNGVKATGEFSTEKMLSLELANVEGEVNTFKGEERYAFELELNVFDLFETKAELELTRSKKDGSLLPNTCLLYTSAAGDTAGFLRLRPCVAGKLCLFARPDADVARRGGAAVPDGAMLAGTGVLPAAVWAVCHLRRSAFQCPHVRLDDAAGVVRGAGSRLGEKDGKRAAAPVSRNSACLLYTSRRAMCRADW